MKQSKSNPLQAVIFACALTNCSTIHYCKLSSKLLQKYRTTVFFLRILCRKIIGLLLYKKHNKLVAEYSLKRTDGAIGITEYRLLHKLPKELKESLPDLDLLKAKLAEKMETEEE
jgi:hypothetical protein